jgi:large subunit ribosomal protein L9
MKVVLIKNIPNVGNKGEVKEVSDGYAQNFLIAKNLAMPATKTNIDKVTAEKKKNEQKGILSFGKVKKLMNKLKGLELTISAKANEKGTLFAGIGEKEVYGALKDLNIVIDLKHFKLDKHIKELGRHDIVIKLDHGLEAKVRVLVV